MSAIIKTTTAKTPTEIKEWVTNNQHHRGAWLTKEKRQVKGLDDAYYFELAGYAAKLLIKPDVYAKCCLTPYGAPENKMFRWDDIEEKAKPHFGKLVTTSPETYIANYRLEEHIVGEKCGVRQGLLKAVEYFYPTLSDKEAVAYYVIQGTLDDYLMRCDSGEYAVVITNMEH